MASHNTTTAFDELVCLNILQYINVSSWTIDQPFLISKTFNNAFNSDQFTRDFLMRTFRLTQLDDLQKAIDLMRDVLLEHSNDEKKKENKKRKKDEEQETVTILPLNLRDVLKIYVKCFRKGDLIVMKEKVDNLLQNVSKRGEIVVVSEIIDKMNCFKTGIEIQEAYQKLEQGNSLNSIFYYVGSEEYAIPPKLCPSMFRKLKGVYVLGIDGYNRLENKESKISVIMFLDCGYPLFIETNYEERVDSYRSINEKTEVLTVYGKQVFSHYERCCYHFNNEYTNSISRELFNIIQSLVLKDDISKVFREENQLSKHPPEAIKEGLMYNFFEMAFGENAMAFRQDDEWIPFRQIGDKDEMSDDEELDDEDDEKPKKKQYKRKIR